MTITATYPGATPQTMNDAVLSLIERELSSVKNLLYFDFSEVGNGPHAGSRPGTRGGDREVALNTLGTTE